MQQLRARLPQVEFIGVSPDPCDTQRSLGIGAFPLYGDADAAGPLPPGVAARARPRWRAALRLVAELDLLIVSGGGQLDDFWGGPWSHPWTMLQWTACARLRGVPVSYLGVGVDHLQHALSRRFSVLAMRLAQQRSFRETDSRALLQALGLRAASAVCPDVVFALTPPSAANTAAPFAVLSPISRKTWSKDATPVHERYLAALADAGQALAASGLQLRIAVTQPAMDSDDAAALAALLAARGVTGVSIESIACVDDYLRAVVGANLVVASRLHAVILALVAGAPVVALSHLPKVERVMRDSGLAAHCLPLQQATPDAVVNAVCQAATQTTAMRSLVADATRRFRTALAATFDQVGQLAVTRGAG